MSPTTSGIRSKLDAIHAKLDSLEGELTDLRIDLQAALRAKADESVAAASGVLNLAQLGDRVHRIANFIIGIRGEVHEIGDEQKEIEARIDEQKETEGKLP